MSTPAVVGAIGLGLQAAHSVLSEPGVTDADIDLILWLSPMADELLNAGLRPELN